MMLSLSRTTAIMALTTSTCLSIVGVSEAATIYTSKSAFLAATTVITTVDSEGLTPPDTAIGLINPTTISGVTFNNTVGSFFALNCATLPDTFSNCDRTIPLIGATTVAGSGT